MSSVQISSSYFKLLYDFMQKHQYHKHLSAHENNKLFEISQNHFSIKYPITDFNFFYEKLREIHHPQDLIFDLTQTIEYKHYGLIAYLATYASNLQEALFYLEKFSSLLIDPIDQDGLKIRQKYKAYEIYWPLWHPDCIALHEINIAAMTCILKKILASDLSEDMFESIAFAAKPMRPLPQYQHFYHCELSFSQDSYCIRVPHTILNVVVQSSDQQLLDVLLNQAEIALAQTKPKEDNIQQKVLHVLNHYLEAALDIPSSEALAHMLNMSRRTLHRKLEAQNLSYRNLVIDTKMQYCLKLLKHSDHSLTDIALALGYTNQSSLGRAFKQHYGFSMRHFKSIPSSNIENT